MRILDEETDRSCNRVTVYLTRGEALELRDSLEALVIGPANRHEYVSDEEYRKEVTLCLYDLGALDQLNDRSRRLIQFDE